MTYDDDDRRAEAILRMLDLNPQMLPNFSGEGLRLLARYHDRHPGQRPVCEGPWEQINDVSTDCPPANDK